MLNLLILIVFGFLSIVGSLPLLFAKKASLVMAGLLLTMVSIAVLYFSLSAEFLGVLQIIIYSGAILIMFVFILSYVSASTEDIFKGTFIVHKLLAICFAGLIFVLLAASVVFSKFGKMSGFESFTSQTTLDNPQILGITSYKMFFMSIVLAGAILCIVATSVVYILNKKATVNKDDINVINSIETGFEINAESNIQTDVETNVENNIKIKIDNNTVANNNENKVDFDNKKNDSKIDQNANLTGDNNQNE
jgi:NADH:ubiquinone oxidoreductase subunit 6 (subunit J)